MNRVENLMGQLRPTAQEKQEQQLRQELASAAEKRPFFGKKTGPNQSGGRLVAEALSEQGVTHVFTLTGGHIAPILVGCNQQGIRVVDVRDEATTVFAADAVARITGIPGVAIVTAGPGLTNTITPVKNAQMAESPVIVMGGATSMLLKGRGSLQDIDQFALMRPHCKACFSIKRVAEIIPTLRGAFDIARRGVPGPVFIEYPLETIWPRESTEDSIIQDRPAAFNFSVNGMLAWAGEKYAQWHVKSVFRNAFSTTYPPLERAGEQQYMASFSEGSIKKLLNVLREAERPVFVVGSQATLHPPLVDKVVQALERLNIPVYLSGMARGLMGRTHKLQYRHKRGLSLKACDCAVLLGVSCDFRLDYGRGINKKAFFAMVNLDQNKLSQNSDLRRKDLTVHGDPGAFVLRLAEAAERFQMHFECNRWKKEMKAREQKREQQIDKTYEDNRKAQAEGKRDAPALVHPIACCKALEKAIDDDSFIVADGGDFVGTASYILKPRKPLRWLDPGAFGTLGVGAGFAMGAKSISPKSEVWIVFGDGSFGWSVMEFDTFKRMGLPVIAVIGNDACWSQMWRDQVRLLRDPVATELEYAHYEKVVEGFGCSGILVRSEAELESAFMEAKKLARAGKPVVVNVLLGKSTFREGSISL